MDRTNDATGAGGKPGNQAGNPSQAGQQQDRNQQADRQQNQQNRDQTDRDKDVDRQGGAGQADRASGGNADQR